LQNVYEPLDYKMPHRQGVKATTV